MIRAAVTLPLAMALGVAAGCDSPVRPTILEIAPDSVELGVGDTVRLALTAGGAPVSGTVTWSSSDAAVATISSGGLVTAEAIGVAVVRGATAGGFAECTVTVGPLIVGSWSGTQDSVMLLLTINQSVTSHGVTAVGSMRVGAAPSVFVTGSGNFVGDSLRMTLRGTNIDGDLKGRLETLALLRATLVLNAADTLAMALERG